MASKVRLRDSAEGAVGSTPVFLRRLAASSS
jgi:hypothetical protein